MGDGGGGLRGWWPEYRALASKAAPDTPLVAVRATTVRLYSCRENESKREQRISIPMYTPVYRCTRYFAATSTLRSPAIHSLPGNASKNRLSVRSFLTSNKNNVRSRFYPEKRAQKCSNVNIVNTTKKKGEKIIIKKKRKKRETRVRKSMKLKLFPVDRTSKCFAMKKHV